MLEDLLRKYVEWWTRYPHPLDYNAIESSLKEKILDIPRGLLSVLNMPLAFIANSYLEYAENNTNFQYKQHNNI